MGRIRGLTITTLTSRPLPVAALAIVLAEAALAAADAPGGVLATLALLVAPGLCAVPLLPPPARASALAALAAVPALGLAVSAVALTSVAAVGIDLSDVSIRLTLLAIVVAGFLIPGASAPLPAFDRREALAAAGLAAAVAVGILFQQRILGQAPVPGNDWAKYLLYADEIRAQGSLLIDNPFWMLGVPFREEPGVPALYGAFLQLADQPASVLMHGIWPIAVAATLSVFAYVRATWGALAGVLAAALWAVMPLVLDVLAWHGAPNLAAIALVPLVLLGLAALIDGRLDPGAAVGLALALLALAAVHRLTTVLVGAVVLAAAGYALVRSPGARASLAWTAGAAVVLGGGVAYDLLERNRTFGGTQGAEAYSATKVDLDVVLDALTPVLAAVAIVATALAVRAAWRGDRRPLLPLALLAVTAVLGYAWIVDVPVVYFRMAYYLPLALVPIVAAALAPLRRRGAAIGAALCVAVAIPAWPQADDAREFYDFATPASLRGLDWLTAELRPDEVVVTDRCWSFLATWLLHTRTLPGIAPADIQPKAEAVRARQGREVLAGTPEGRELARRLGVRFMVVDPTCTDPQGQPLPPPPFGEPVYVSERLVVLRSVL